MEFNNYLWSSGGGGKDGTIHETHYVPYCSNAREPAQIKHPTKESHFTHRDLMAKKVSISLLSEIEVEPQHYGDILPPIGSEWRISSGKLIRSDKNNTFQCKMSSILSFYITCQQLFSPGSKRWILTSFTSECDNNVLKCQQNLTCG